VAAGPLWHARRAARLSGLALRPRLPHAALPRRDALDSAFCVRPPPPLGAHAHPCRLELSDAQLWACQGVSCGSRGAVAGAHAAREAEPGAQPRSVAPALALTIADVTTDATCKRGSQRCERWP
jgi:hypothetical protein